MRAFTVVFAASALVVACSQDPAPAGTTTTTGNLGSGGANTAGAGGADAAGAGGGGDGGAMTTTAGAGGAGGAGGAAEIGIVSGMCGEIEAAELVALSPPFKLDNEIDFGAMAMMEPDPNALPPETKEVYDDGNLGGSSLWSEVFSFEVLRRCELATLLKTEGEIVYSDPAGKKTDLLVEVDGAKIGVSVTRAYHFPPRDPFTVAEAQALLEGKLSDIHLSSANVAPADAWQKQILHVLAYEPQYVISLSQAYDAIDPSIKGDTIVIVTLTSGDDAFIY